MARVSSSLFHVSDGSDGAPSLRYLGTAGFVLRLGGRTLTLDPYVSRPGVAAALFRRLAPDTGAIERWIPRTDDVLVGHAHFDHVLDAPHLCARDGARLVGSSAAGHVARAAGVPASQVRVTAGREDIPCGNVVVRGLPSRHGKALFGRVPLPGDIPAPPPWPPRARDLRHGLVLNWLVRAGDLAFVHIDSADFIDAELEGVRADVLCLCAIGRRYRPGYTERAIALLRPRWVVPCHWDWFFGPLEPEPPVLPGVDVPGFLEEIRRAGAEPVLLRCGDWWSVPASGA